MNENKESNTWHGTTIVSVRKKNEVVNYKLFIPRTRKREFMFFQMPTYIMNPDFASDEAKDFPVS